jgi:hypothetical protein
MVYFETFILKHSKKEKYFLQKIEHQYFEFFYFMFLEKNSFRGGSSSVCRNADMINRKQIKPEK